MTIELEQVLSLPVVVVHIVPAEWMDSNQHMNVMYYTGIGNMAFERFFDVLGLNYEHFQSHGRGMFALNQVLSYLSELRMGDKVQVHTGFVGHDAKRLHFIHYIVNMTSQKLACIDERLAMYIDMNTRRSTNFEPDILAKLDKAEVNYSKYNWTPELSGIIKLKK